MNTFEIETIRRLREHADDCDNYNAGWDIIAEAYTDEELLELFNGESDEDYAESVRLFGDELERQAPATTYEEAFKRVESVVNIHEEQRRAAINEIF